MDVANHFYSILAATEGEDPDREGLVETPDRAARAWVELTSGYGCDVDALLKTFESDGYDEMIVVADIPFASLCVPSKQIVNRVGGAAPARDIGVGDQLWTLADGRLVKTEVRRVVSRQTRDLVEVKTSRGTIRLTPDHPLKGVRGWIEAGDLEAGDLLEFFPPKQLCREHHDVTHGHDLGYLIGAVASDGSIQSSRISVVVSDREFADRVVRSWAVAFNIEASAQPIMVPSGFRKEEIQMYRVRVVSSFAASCLRRWLDIRGTDKTRGFGFPRVVASTQEMMQGFLDGYCDGDGFVVKGRHGRRQARALVTTNTRFATELAGYLGTSVTRQGEAMHRVHVSDRWHKEGWFGKHGYRQLEEFSLPLDSELAVVEDVQRRLTTSSDGRPIKPYTVYSFTCEPHPTFLVGGHLSHNCEHHMLPFIGKAHVVYIPDGRIVGLSKVPRLVDAYAKRLQVQERLTMQVADALWNRLKPQGVLVVVEANHMCATLRGVKKHGVQMRTSAVRGLIKEDAAARAEAFALIGNGIHR